MCYHSGPEWNWEWCQWRVLGIPQSSSNTGTSSSDWLVLYPGHSLLFVISRTHCREAVGVFYHPSQLGKIMSWTATSKEAIRHHLCYIIAGWFSFILSFFVGYILSFGLVRLWTVRLLVQVFTLVPRWEMRLECKLRHARKLWTGIFSDHWKKQELRFEPRRRQSSWVLRNARHVCWVSELRLDSGPASSPGEMTDGRCRNSQYSKNCVSLSPRVEKLKVRKC